jgi:hypothetical protein
MAVPQIPTKWTDWMRENMPTQKIGEAGTEESELTVIGPSNTQPGLVTFSA